MNLSIHTTLRAWPCASSQKLLFPFKECLCNVQRRRAKSGAFDLEDDAEEDEEGEDSPPAWSRGHHPASTKRKRATKPSKFQDDEDEVEDFDGEVKVCYLSHLGFCCDRVLL